MITNQQRALNLGYSIGEHNFELGLSLAPMAGNTNLAYRALCRKFGAELTTTEMVSSMALRHNDKKSLKYLAKAADETPVAAQIFGADPETLGMAAALVSERGFHIVDLNVGCPVPKITGCGGGSALLRDPQLAHKCVESMVSSSSVPVTVKIRAGWDDQNKNAPEFAKVVEQAGAVALTIHGRTREQKYTGNSDLDIISKVSAAVDIPVIGNGDVTDITSAQAMAETGVNGIAIGRGALGKPWLFEQLTAHFKGDDIPSAPLPCQRAELLLELGQGVCELYTEMRGMRVMRRLAADFFHGLPGAPQLRKQCSQLSTLDDLRVLAEQLSSIKA